MVAFRDWSMAGVLAKRGMPRLSDLLPEVAEPGGPIDDLDAWLDTEDVPDGAPPPGKDDSQSLR